MEEKLGADGDVWDVHRAVDTVHKLHIPTRTGGLLAMFGACSMRSVRVITCTSRPEQADCIYKNIGLVKSWRCRVGERKESGMGEVI